MELAHYGSFDLHCDVPKDEKITIIVTIREHQLLKRRNVGIISGGREHRTFLFLVKLCFH